MSYGTVGQRTPPPPPTPEAPPPPQPAPEQLYGGIRAAGWVTFAAVASFGAVAGYAAGGKGWAVVGGALPAWYLWALAHGGDNK